MRPPGSRAGTPPCGSARWTALGIGASPEEILVCQTGLIGIPFPMATVDPEVRRIIEARAGGPDAGAAAARAIMTTDTVPKVALARGNGITVGAMAKGAAMLAPHMATMLALCTTDAAVDPGTLQTALRAAVDVSFNSMTVDGCTSTNDTVLVLASGRGPTPSLDTLTAALSEVCVSLAEQMVDDAEGATKVSHIRVTGAESDAAAHRAARKVADSMLVQCSLNGEDPYWGRMVSELGSAGVAFDIDTVSVAYGDVVVCAGGVAVDHDAAARGGPPGRAAHRDQLRSRAGERIGGGAGDRSRLRLHRREPDDVVRRRRDREEQPGPEGGGAEHGLAAGRGAAVHPALPGQDRRGQVRRERAERGGGCERGRCRRR